MGLGLELIDGLAGVVEARLAVEEPLAPALDGEARAERLEGVAVPGVER